MMCFNDRTYCASPECKCDRKLTDEIRKAARYAGLPLSVGFFCGGLEMSPSRFEIAEKSSKDKS